MGSTWGEVVGKLRGDKGYRQQFTTLYSDGITSANIQDAIATYERSLVTVDAPFDRYLQGDEGAISSQAREGYRLFKSYGCSACHQGVNVGGNMFSRMGVMGDYFSEREAIRQADLGRYNVTGMEGDKHVFKVPSLRLVTRTPPYFHDGSVEQLDEAIKVMARYQLGRSIDDADIEKIIAFLHALEGEPFQPMP
jgi:cytochrome c peroxidase